MRWPSWAWCQGIPQSETMAVGDSGNASMIAAGGVAMGNALHEAVAVADWVALG